MTAFRAGVLLSFLLATSLVAPVVARAADVTDVVAGVRVAAPSCPIAPLPLPAFIEALRVELAGRAATRGTTLVTLAIEPCDPGTTRVQVTVSDARGELSLSRAVGLEDVTPAARPRALALAVAELVRGAQPAAPAPSSSAPVEAAASAPTPPPALPVLTFAGDALLSLFPARGTALWGGRLSLSVEQGRWQVGAFADVATGERRYDVGQVALWSLAAGLVAGPRWVSGRVSLEPALVGALGWAHIAGRAGEAGVSAEAGDGLTAAVRARLAVGFALGHATSVRVLVEGGFMARGFDATVNGARAAGLSGPSVVVGLGLERGR
jgi:hypothetical protein